MFRSIKSARVVLVFPRVLLAPSKVKIAFACVALFPAFSAGREKEPTLTSVVAERLRASQAEVTQRALELKALRTATFDKQFQANESHITALAQRLASHERRVAAVARGLAADGDENLAQTRVRMGRDAGEIRARAYAFDRQWSRVMVRNDIVANVVGVLSVQSRDGETASRSTKFNADVDADGVEETIAKLQRWRVGSEAGIRALEPRFEELKVRLLSPPEAVGTDYARAKPLTKAQARLLGNQLLRGVPLTDQQFDNAMKDYANSLDGELLDIRRQADDYLREWGSRRGDPSMPLDAFTSLGPELTKAKAIKKEADRGKAIEIVESEVRRRIHEVIAFDRCIRAAEAIELEATAIVLLRENKDEVLDSIGSRSPTEEEKRALDVEHATLAELVGVTIPRAQEINRSIRMSREMWLR